MRLGAEYWDGVAEKMKSLYVKNPFLEYKHNEMLRLINRWSQDNEDGTVLKTDLWEEALEPGGPVFDFATKNGKVWGIDISPKVVKWACQKTGQKGIRFNACVSDVKKLAFKDNRFDLIISTSTLDHFPEIDVALKELYRTLKPKGVIILILDNATNLLLSLIFALMRALRKYPTFYVERTYSLWKAKDLLRGAGFRIEDSTAIVHTVPPLPMTVNELCRRGNSRILLGICRRVIGLSDIVGKSNVFLKYLTGYYVAVKATKR